MDKLLLARSLRIFVPNSEQAEQLGCLPCRLRIQAQNPAEEAANTRLQLQLGLDLTEYRQG
jgi:hypothetical protein